MPRGGPCMSSNFRGGHPKPVGEVGGREGGREKRDKGSGDTQRPSGAGGAGGGPLRTRLPCSTSPSGAPAAAADMVGGAVVCLPTAGHEREREGAELLLGGAGRGGLNPGPPPSPRPQQELLGCPSPRPQAWGGWCWSIPLPVSPPRQPPEWGGTHGDRALPAAVCVGRGGAGSCPHLGYHMPRPHRWGKNGLGGLRKGGEKERKTAR